MRAYSRAYRYKPASAVAADLHVIPKTEAGKTGFRLNAFGGETSRSAAQLWRLGPVGWEIEGLSSPRRVVRLEC